MESANPPPCSTSVIVTASDPGVSLGGTHVDEDEVLAADFGQWGLAR